MQLYDKLRKPFSSLIYIFMGVWFELMGRWRRFLVIYVEKLWQIILTDMVSESTRKLYYISPLLWTMAITSLHKFFSTFIDIKWRWLSLAIFLKSLPSLFFFSWKRQHEKYLLMPYMNPIDLIILIHSGQEDLSLINNNHKANLSRVLHCPERKHIYIHTRARPHTHTYIYRKLPAPFWETVWYNRLGTSQGGHWIALALQLIYLMDPEIHWSLKVGNRTWI